MTIGEDRSKTMKLIQVKLPDKMAETLQMTVQSGWFNDESEVVRMALGEFLQHRRFALDEQFQRADVVWAVQHKKTIS